MTCLTWEAFGTAGETWNGGNRSGAHIKHWTRSEPVLREWLKDPNVLLVGQNVAYDFAVVGAEFPALIPLIFQAYENDRVTDTMLRQKILDIAGGCYRGRFDTDGETWIKYGYSLFDLTRRLTGRLLKKDGWRMRYGELRDIPVERWIARAIEMQNEARYLLKLGHPFGGHDPKDLEAILLDPPEQIIQYPLDDATTTLDCFLKQEPCAAEYLKSQFHEARAAWALHLSSCWGMRTDAKGVAELIAITEAAIVDVKARLIETGLVRKDGSRDTKKAAEYMLQVCAAGKLPVRKTKGGGVSLDAEACLATEDPVLLDYERYTGLGKTLNSDVPMLLAGTVTPIHCRYDIAETSRTTCSGPNLQNVSKK